MLRKEMTNQLPMAMLSRCLTAKVPSRRDRHMIRLEGAQASAPWRELPPTGRSAASSASGPAASIPGTITLRLDWRK